MTTETKNHKLARLAEFSRRPCCRAGFDSDYQAPAPAEVHELIKLAGWSQVQAAKLAGVSYNVSKGSSTVRRWYAPADSKGHRPISYATWRLLLMYAGLAFREDDLEKIGKAKA